MTTPANEQDVAVNKEGQKQTASPPNFFIPLDTSWFDREPERYLERDDFREFQEVSGIDLRQFVAKDRETIQKAQHALISQSVIANEIQSAYFGFGFPFMLYTHDLRFSSAVPHHNIEIDKIIVAFDMGDSLRRRHFSLSHAVIPHMVNDLYQSLGRPVVIKNLGAGTGLDTLNAARYSDGSIAQIINYDNNAQAVALGQRMTKHLEERGIIHPGIVQYIPKSLTKSTEPADLIIKIGVICGLQDFAAEFLLAQSFAQLSEGGKLIVSSSNVNMYCHEPLTSFLIQHVGAKDDPFAGWSLNCRTEEGLRGLLTRAGFKEIAIYSDTDYPGKDKLPEKKLYGVDTLPSEVMGYDHPGFPLRLPPKEVLDKGTAYNWIAVATKV
jgi:hypothetical protein